MDKEILCFKINSKELMLEQVLVEYNNIPVYFICKDSERQYYVVLCIDIENEKYIITKTTFSKLINLLKKNITMREIILSEIEFWEVSVGETIEEDVCENKNIELINLEDLPRENSYFKVVSKSHNEFLNELEEILYSQADDFEMIDVEINSSELKEYSSLPNLNKCFNKNIDIKETKILEGLKLADINRYVSSYDKEFDDKEFEKISNKNAANIGYIKYKVELECNIVLLAA